MATLRLIIILTLSFTATVISVTGHNITEILNEFPSYTSFNNYLTQTKLNDEINRRETITVLVFNDTVVSEYLSGLDISVVKNALSVHVLLDYFDLPKLQTIGGGSVMTTTLFQTTGEAENGAGFVNITDLVAGKVGFGSGGSGSKLNALFSRSVKQIPYNISVIEITSPIIAPGVLNRSQPLDVNISSLLEKSGCKTFAKLISDTGVLQIYETTEPRGLTVFAPSDAAFNVASLPDFKNLSNNDLISLLLYHALPVYVPKGSLLTVKGPIGTLATNQVQKFDLTVRTNGDSVTLDSGVDNSHVESTLLDKVPLSIFKIDHVLIPAGFLPHSPESAPVKSPESSPPAPVVPVTAPVSTPVQAPVQVPVHGPVAASPAPVARNSPVKSPPASSPTTSSPVAGPAPADSPDADTGNNDNNNSSDGVKASVMFLALVTVAVSGMISSVFG
ncbi:putative fasciclin-like arabinogalactan protein [Helianthus annuus]|nr:putative fasciclin-like arabinogalactan protein [Helianthus annuus]